MLNLGWERLALLLFAIVLAGGTLTGSVWVYPRIRTDGFRLLLAIANFIAIGVSTLLVIVALLAP